MRVLEKKLQGGGATPTPPSLFRVEVTLHLLSKQKVSL